MQPGSIGIRQNEFIALTPAKVYLPLSNLQIRIEIRSLDDGQRRRLVLGGQIQRGLKFRAIKHNGMRFSLIRLRRRLLLLA